MGTLILMQGLPGSGKSEWVKRFLKKHENENWVVINKDSIRGMLNPLKWNSTIELVTKTSKISMILHAASQKCNIIIDETHLTKESLENYKTHIFPDWFRNSYNFKVIRVDTPFEICKQRNALREPRRRVPDARMQQMYETYEKFVPEGFELMMVKNI